MVDADTRNDRIALYTDTLAAERHSANFLSSTSIMESFAKLMSAIGASSSDVDFVASLPVEIAEIILLKLDPRSLVNAAQVSRKWMRVCAGSSRLRRTARRHLRKENQRMSDQTVVTKRLRAAARRQVHLAESTSRQVGVSPSASPVFRAIEVKRPVPMKRRSGDKNPSKFPTRKSLRLR